MKKHFYDIVKNDNTNYECCIKKHYYDTYINRNEVFMQILNDMKNI